MQGSQRSKRLALFAVTAGMLLLASRSFHPARSSASTRPIQPSDAGARAPAMPPRLLGEIQGHEFRILVHTSELGPRYTVISPDGVVIARDLSDEDVAREFPALEFETLTADAPSDSDPLFPER
jgi:hypothetical protein